MGRKGGEEGTGGRMGGSVASSSEWMVSLMCKSS